MKIIKKIMYSVLFVSSCLIMYSTIAKAATTVTVTADVLNLREGASTSSEVLATLSEGIECEFIEESGDWYKVKYRSYTGYVSKEYVTMNEDTTQNNANQTDGNQIETNKADTDQVEENKINTNEIDTEQTEGDSSNGDGNQQDTATNVGDEMTQTTGKISVKTDIKIVPLIYSSKIGELAKDETVTILTDMNGWEYIQTDTVTGWIRSNVITDKTTSSVGLSGENTQTANNTSSNSNENATDNNQEAYTEKTMYISESSVNLRKEPNTSSEIIMVVGLNQKLTVIGESGDWYLVKTSEGNAYVLKTLVADKQTSTSRGGSLINHVDATGISTTTSTVQEPTTVTQSNSTATSSSSNSSSIAKGKEVVNYAKQFLGVPYVYGGASKSGFDCSGFTMYVYNKFGISMRHGAQAQAKLGTAVNADKKLASSLKQNLQPGDLVFFLDYETMDEIGHCGIYIGDGEFIHASSGSGYCVKINSLLPGEYYNTRYCAARRVL